MAVSKSSVLALLCLARMLIGVTREGGPSEEDPVPPLWPPRHKGGRAEIV